MRRAGLLVGQTLELLRGEVRPGVTTLALDALAEDFIRSHGGIPNFQLVPGYAHTLCTSVNDEVVHGIPSSSRVLREGDLVSVDCGAELEGWNGDAAFSAVVGGRDAARPEDLRLIDVTEDALWAGITALVVGGRLYAVGEAVEARHRVRGCRRRTRVRDHRGVRRARDRAVHARGPADPQLRGARQGAVGAGRFTGAIDRR